MKAGIINARWAALAPWGRLDADYWLQIVELLAEKGLDHTTATDDDVREAMELKDQIRDADMAYAREKRNQAAALTARARKLEERHR